MRILFLGLLLTTFSGTLALVAACGESDPPEARATGDRASPDAASARDAAADVELVPADTERVVATAKGGMSIGEQDGSTCRSADSTFTFVLSSRQLTWKACVPMPNDGGGGPGPWTFVEGEKILTEDESAPLLAALRALAPTSRAGCGFDKPTYTVSVTTPRGTSAYIDDFYACEKRGAYVSGLNAVFHELDQLTGTSSL